MPLDHIHKFDSKEIKERVPGQVPETY